MSESEDDWGGAYAIIAAASAEDQANRNPAGVPRPSSASHPPKRKPGRPKGSVGSRLLNQAIQSQVEAESSNPEPGSSGYARDCKRKIHEKMLEERELDLQLVRSANQNQSAVSTDAASLAHLRQYGSLEAICSAALPVHQSLCESMSLCHKKNLWGEEDPLVQHHLADAMSTVSTSVLCKQLGETRVGDRSLSISSAFWLLAGFLVQLSS